MSFLKSSLLGFSLAVTVTAISGCSNSGSTTDSQPAGPTYSATVSAGSLSFSQIIGNPAPATQTITLTNTGTGTLAISGIGLSGANTTLFYTPLGTSNVCGMTLATASSCMIPIGFQGATGSGTYTATLTFTDNATAGNQTVALTGVATSQPAASGTTDCSTTTGTGAASTGGNCPALTIAGDPIASGGFHGYADPSYRKDVDASVFNFGYSWARVLADSTHVVESHIGSNTNGGSTITYVGTLFPTTIITNPSGNTIAAGTNYTSHEVIDLIPIPLSGASAGQTMWVQAHEEYLVQPQQQIYAQRDQSLYISVTAAVVTTPSTPGTQILGLGTATEARLGAVSVDPVRNITQRLSSLSSALSKCATFGQPALWYQSSTGYLYLALECGENATLGYDAHELSHYLFYTTPTGSDASKWVWSYANELATPAQAAKLSTQENPSSAYTFFTEPEFVQGKSGQLFMMLTPGAFAPQTAQQPVIQYGCRTVPVTLAASGGTLATDTTTGVLSYTARTGESDLYSGVNEGPAACTYDPNTTTGIVMGRKYENDPTYGFDIFPVATGVNP